MLLFWREGKGNRLVKLHSNTTSVAKVMMNVVIDPYTGYVFQSFGMVQYFIKMWQQMLSLLK